jgi:hypothetical protein
MIPSIGYRSTRTYAQPFKTAPVHGKCGLARLPCQMTRKKRQNGDLRDWTAERNAETLVRVQSISPEAGGLPTEVYLEKWLI